MREKMICLSDGLIRCVAFNTPSLIYSSLFRQILPVPGFVDNALWYFKVRRLEAGETRMILRIVGMMALASVLAGCASLVQTAISNGINVGRTLPADRSLYNVLDDLSIKNTINNALLDEALLLDINTDVYQGMVMLTGSVRDAATRQKAEDLTRKVDGVRELYNEIKVTDKSWLKSLPKDTWIENTLGARMVLAPGVRAVNYQLRVANGVVYILGIARSE